MKFAVEGFFINVSKLLIETQGHIIPSVKRAGSTCLAPTCAGHPCLINTSPKKSVCKRDRMSLLEKKVKMCLWVYISSLGEIV